MQLLHLIEPTISALGYELVDVEREGHGLLRVLIDKPSHDPRCIDGGITIDDCEKVSAQISPLLLVENVPYERLEVSSPGLDRPLRKITDYVRFSGMAIELKLRMPVANRKNYTGLLHAPQQKAGVETIGLEYEGKEGKCLLEFTLADVDKARLVPIIDFKRDRK